MATDLATLSIRVDSLEAKRAGKRLDDLGRKGGRAEKKMSGLSKTALRLAGAFTGLLAVGAVSRAFSAATRTAIKFEASISELSAITGATGKDLEFYEQKAKEMGRTTTLSASQVAEGFKLVASAKPDLLASAEALSQVTKSAITLAEATGQDLPTAADTLGQALNQFGKGAESADRFINVLAAGAQKGASFVSETAEALKFAGASAADAGVNFEATNAAIQNLSTVGIKGSEAGTALRNVYLRLQQQTESKFNPAIVGQAEALRNLRDANLSVTEKIDLFGVRSVVAANQLIRQADAVAELEGELTGTETAYDQQKTKVDNLEGSLKQLGSAYEGLQLRIAGEADPTLRTLTDTITDALNAYTDFLGEIEASGDSFGVLDFVLKETILLLFAIKTTFSDFVDTVKLGLVVVKERFDTIVVRVLDTVDAFKTLIEVGKAIANFDLGLAKQVIAARDESRKLAEEQIRDIENQSLAEQDAIGAEIDARAEAAQLFRDKIRFGNEAATIADAEKEAAIEQKKLTAEEIEQQRLLNEEIARRAQIEENQGKLDKVSDKFRTDIEAAEDAAAAQLEILRKLGEDSNNLTAEQEKQRLETIKRVNEELEGFRTEQAEKEAEAEQKKLDAALAAEQRKAEALTEFRILAAENKIEAEEIRFEEELERLQARGEKEQVAQEIIDRAKENARLAHEKRLTEIEEKEKAAREAMQNKTEKSMLSKHLEFLTQMTQGTAQHSKTMFKINKALALAQATVNLPEAVSSAYKHGAAAGGPILGSIYGGLAFAAQIAQIQAISSTSFEGGGAGTTPSLAGSSGTINSVPVTQDAGSSDDLLQSPTANVNDEVSRNQVIVTGNVGWTPEIIDQVAEGLREATNERDVIIFEEGSRQAQDLREVTNGAG